MINRKKLVTSHNPSLKEIDPYSPLSVGNGDFAFTADVTGLQSFPECYESALPLCTQSQWGWHTTPVSAERYSYTLEDLPMTVYDTHSRPVGYPVERTNDEVYTWLRVNPHRLNLARIGFKFYGINGELLDSSAVKSISQKLNLYTGILFSEFTINEIPVEVRTACHPTVDGIAVEATSTLLAVGKMKVEIAFPYGSPETSASDWAHPERHVTIVTNCQPGKTTLTRRLDKDSYFVSIFNENNDTVESIKPHTFLIKSNAFNKLRFCVGFSSVDRTLSMTTEEVFEASRAYWQAYWENGAMVQFSASENKNARELERRVILSQYLTAIQCCGIMPPQETGLTCNSWYGKFHLEMHYWHSLHFAYWNRPDFLEHSMPWYKEILPEARQLAREQGYKGARWPKMVGPEGDNAPSEIAPLLIWQQPHVIEYCEALYQAHPEQSTLEKYQELVFETAEFMADFAVYDEANGRYVLGPPVIPVQERFDPKTCLNPTFELEYWHRGLTLANQWRERLGQPMDEKWSDVAEKMAKPTVANGVYVAQENAPDTFEHFNTDHPSMLGAYGLLDGERINPQTMRQTLLRVVKEWNFESLWGWDFAVMALTAAKLGDFKFAMELLLFDGVKNQYLKNGHNRQGERADLPLYLPGNGSLLLGTAMLIQMVQGEVVDGVKTCVLPGGWIIQSEQI